MNKTNNHEIFTHLKNKNLQEGKIIELLYLASKDISINKIEHHGRNILFFACLHDNDNVFKVISENFSKDFKEDFKKCVLITYTNKNPQILKLALDNMHKLSEDETEDLLKKFAHNCFRSENIETTQNWLMTNLNKKNLELFISELFRNHNTPYLSQIAKIDGWRELIKKHNFTGANDKHIFYQRLINEKTPDNSLIIENKIEKEIFSIEKSKQDLVVLKRKKKIINLNTI